MTTAPFDLSLPHGLCVGIPLPGPGDLLHPEEAHFAESLLPRRRTTWIGGRIALRKALGRLGVDCGPILATPRGAPALPDGIAGSVSHKDDLAVALADRTADWRIGIDVEKVEAPRVGIDRKILTSEERADWSRLPADRRWENTLLRFSIKEAIYKAIDPFVQRFVGFEEVAVFPREDGQAEVSHPFSALRMEARWRLEDSWILATARAREVRP